MEIPDAGDWIDKAPWRDRKVTLLWISAAGATAQGWTLMEKRALLPRPGGTYFVVWTGEYHSEVRRLTDEQVAAVHERIRL